MQIKTLRFSQEIDNILWNFYGLWTELHLSGYSAFTGPISGRTPPVRPDACSRRVGNSPSIDMLTRQPQF